MAKKEGVQKVEALDPMLERPVRSLFAEMAAMKQQMDAIKERSTRFSDAIKVLFSQHGIKSFMTQMRFNGLLARLDYFESPPRMSQRAFEGALLSLKVPAETISAAKELAKARVAQNGKPVLTVKVSFPEVEAAKREEKKRAKAAAGAIDATAEDAGDDEDDE